MKKSHFVIGASALFLPLCGCNQPDPAAACSAPDTMSNIYDIIRTSATKQIYAGDADLISITKSLNLSSIISFDTITLASVDKDTKKISCEAVAHIAVPAKDQATLAGFSEPDSLGYAMIGDDLAAFRGISFVNGKADLNVSYSRQPSADGTQSVFSYSDGGVSAHALLLVARIEKSDRQTAQLTEAAANQAADQSQNGTTPPDGNVNTEGPDNAATPSSDAN